MAITPDDYTKLEAAFATAQKKDVLLYDIMTERFEITTILQRELSRRPALFGKLRTARLKTRRSPRRACTTSRRSSPARR